MSLSDGPNINGLLANFLSAVDARKFIDASRIARDILLLEPDNALIRQYLPVLATAQRSVTERSIQDLVESDDDDNGDDDDDDDGDDSDEDDADSDDEEDSDDDSDSDNGSASDDDAIDSNRKGKSPDRKRGSSNQHGEEEQTAYAPKTTQPLTDAQWSVVVPHVLCFFRPIVAVQLRVLCKSWLRIVDSNDTWHTFYQSVYPTEYVWFRGKYATKCEGDEEGQQQAEQEQPSGKPSPLLQLHNFQFLALVQDGVSSQFVLRGLRDVPTLVAGSAATDRGPQRANCLRMLRVLANEWTHTMRTAIALQSQRTMIPSDAPAVALPLAEVKYWKLTFRHLQHLDDQSRSQVIDTLLGAQGEPLASEDGDKQIAAAAARLAVTLTEFDDTRRQLKRMCSQALWNLKYFKILEKPFSSIADVSVSGEDGRGHSDAQAAASSPPSSSASGLQRLSIIVPSLPKTLKMVAASSRFYNSRERLQPLLRRISQALGARIRAQHTAYGVARRWAEDGRRPAGDGSGEDSVSDDDGVDVGHDTANARQEFALGIKVAESWVKSCRKLADEGANGLWGKFDWDHVLEPIATVPDRLRDLERLDDTVRQLRRDMRRKIAKAFPDSVAPMPIVQLTRRSEELLLQLEQTLRQTQSLRATTPLNLMPKLSLAGLEGTVRTISTPRSWAAGLGALPLVPERTSALGPGMAPTSSSAVAPLGHFLSAQAAKAAAAATHTQATQEAEHTFDIFSSAPAVARQWSTILKTFLQKAGAVVQECDELIQKSRIDLMMRLQGRGGKRRSSKPSQQ